MNNEARELRFDPDIVYGGMGDSDALTMSQASDGDWVAYEALARARTKAIKDCIATARAVMLGHEKAGAPLMATGAVTVEMALEAMLNDTAKAKEKSMDSWQPIETAPRDGTEILLCDTLDADGRPIEGKTWGLFVQVAAWWVDDEGGDGEWTVYCSMVEDPTLHFTPTHWMPLPKNPVGEK